MDSYGLVELSCTYRLWLPIWWKSNFFLELREGFKNLYRRPPTPPPLAPTGKLLLILLLIGSIIEGFWHLILITDVFIDFLVGMKKCIYVEKKDKNNIACYLNDISVSCCIFLHLCQGFLVNIICSCDLLEVFLRKNARKGYKGLETMFTNSSLSGTLEIKSTSSLLLMAHGFISFFRNLFVPHNINRTLRFRDALTKVWHLSKPHIV